MKAILVDVTKCTGCERCVAACIEAERSGPTERPRSTGPSPRMAFRRTVS